MSLSDNPGLEFPALRRPAPRGTRKRIDRQERIRHIKVAYYRLVLNRKPSALAAEYGVSRVTIHNWITAALTYDEPEADMLRQVLLGERE
jgi:hypothetical protein